MPRPDEGMIHAWLDGELDAAEAARVERLVADDPEWAAAAAEARGLIAASSRILGALDVVAGDVIPAGGSAAPVPGAKGARRAVASWLRIAAGFVLVAGVAYMGRDSLASRAATELASGSAVEEERKAPATPPLAKETVASGGQRILAQSASARADAPPPPPAAAPASAAPTNAAPTSATSSDAAPTRADARDRVRARLTDSSNALSDVVVTGSSVAKSATAGVAGGVAAPVQLRAVPASEAERARGVAHAEARVGAASSREMQKILPSPNSIAMATAERDASSDALPPGTVVLEGCWSVQTPAAGSLVIDALQRSLRGLPVRGDSLQVTLAPNGLVAIVRRDSVEVLRGRLRDVPTREAAFHARLVECPR